ncbi:STAS domain-containing protein [Virgibacillus halophilus]|uniref:STAS domain-containing protein n=1 Tax=Tigheibacillus halophilus TaxID=361280 RepID=A0ABU5C7G6_9BACI|nr:STAS domain-containing protein [Virgibacillus halophilus]
MTDLNEELHTYLEDSIATITDKWLALRDQTKGSIYSANASKETEQELREQNTITNQTIISSLFGDKSNFEKKKNEWAHVVAKSRVATATPIPDVLRALSKVRKVFWQQVEHFLEMHKPAIPAHIVADWSDTIHLAFDELYIAFSETYFKLMNDRLSAQQELINELGSPIIKITETTGILPMVGDIDTCRAQTIIENVPAKCVRTGITSLYIDLSGVAIIDTMVANQIFQLTNILNLLGTQTTITGIRPEIAQTAVQLGINFSKINTSSSLLQALKNRYVLQKID